MRQLKITNQITQRDGQVLDKYLLEISKVPLLTPDQEIALARGIKEGNEEALDKMVKANLRFVVSVAKQYQNQGLTLSDLINEGNLGLIKAAQKFDETRGFKFISYAVWWIRQSIMQAIVEQARIVRIPLNKMTTHSQIAKVMARFEQEFQRDPTDDELEEILRIDKVEINALIISATRHLSMDAPFNGDSDGGTLYDVLMDEDASHSERKLMKESLSREIKKILSILPARDADIVCLYYGLNGESGMTLEEIGAIFSLTRERVRQIKERSIRRLQKTTGSKSLKHYLGLNVK